VPIADRGGPAPNRAGLTAAVSERGQIGGDDALVRWQGCGAPGGAPGGEVASCAALADDSAARIVKRYARRVGLDPASYAGHSLRSGFLTSAAESGASIWKLSEVSRHKSLDTLRGYVRRVDLFKEHAGAAFL
jgi:hypothetical protein